MGNKKNSKKEGERDSDKNQILQSMMNQVSQLESSTGAKISKLESQLKQEMDKSRSSGMLEKNLQEEKEKNTRLEADLKHYSDIATKMISLQEGKLLAEITNQKKFDEVEQKLNYEKSKCTNLTKELCKVKDALKDEKSSKRNVSNNLTFFTSEKERLQQEVDNLQNWKEASIIKIKASHLSCQMEHVQKIEELEESASIKGELLVEITTQMAMLIKESSSALNEKERALEELKFENNEKESLLKEKVVTIKEFEDKLKLAESKYKEKETYEEKMKEKIKRNRLKEEMLKEGEEKLKERERVMKIQEEKFIELEKTLKEKEINFKNNNEKLRLKENEMFRVYELVNQLQQRIRNEKINSVIKGQDILSLGKPKHSPKTKLDDKDISTLPNTVRGSEKPSDAMKFLNGSHDGRHSEIEEKDDKITKERKFEKIKSNDTRQKKFRTSESQSSKSDDYRHVSPSDENLQCNV